MAQQIEAFEQRVGWKLDPDLRAFYLHCDGAELIKRRPGCPYRILPLSEIILVLDVGHQENGRYPLVDGSHEAWPDPDYCGPVANSFSEFLENVLRTRRNLYWLGE